MFEDSVDSDRVERHLETLYDISKDDVEGATRPGYSEWEQDAIDYVLGELPSGYDHRSGPFGNVFASRDLDADNLLLVGSHLDTVPNGGKYDGAMGVVTGMEAIEAVYESDADPYCQPTLVIWRAEESPTFGQAMMGSQAALGLLDEDDFATENGEGETLREAMKGLEERLGRELGPDPRDRPIDLLQRSAGYIESHPEQAKVLEDAGDQAGVVTSIRAPVRYKVTITGEEDHSGATPQDREIRSDAIAAASQSIGGINLGAHVADEYGDIVATVGHVSAPGVINQINEEAEFLLDVRSRDEAYRDDFELFAMELMDRITSWHGVDGSSVLKERSDPVELDPYMVDALDRAASAAGTSYQRMPSGAGHDAMKVQAAGIPAGLVFAPSIDGKSHAPEEDTPVESIDPVTRVMAHGLASYEPP